MLKTLALLLLVDIVGTYLWYLIKRWRFMKHLAQLPLRDLEVVLADNGVSEYHFTEYKDLKITVFALHHTVYAHSYKIDDGKLVFVCKNGKCFGNYPLQTVDEFWQLGYGNIRLQET